MGTNKTMESSLTTWFLCPCVIGNRWQYFCPYVIAANCQRVICRNCVQLLTIPIAITTITENRRPNCRFSFATQETAQKTQSKWLSLHENSATHLSKNMIQSSQLCLHGKCLLKKVCKIYQRDSYYLQWHSMTRLSSRSLLLPFCDQHHLVISVTKLASTKTTVVIMLRKIPAELQILPYYSFL